ncbi:D-amino-acid oxidase [Catenulispora sp. MAP12-49]|uniref:FAD-dependent oxidoreductase n=1 Tax=unclassified Catenulispora TaxID=414885 RepID=UPI00351398A2
MPQNTDALVIGAGVSGLTTAVCLAEQGLSVRVLAERPPTLTTSAVAGAILGGPAIADAAEAAAKFSPLERTTPWHEASLAEFGALADQDGTGVHTQRGRLVNRQGDGGQSWAERLPGYQACGPGESAGYPVAFWTTLPIVDMPVYLDYLVGRLAAAGGVLETGNCASPAEAASEAGVVVNCTGVGAADFAGDEGVFPVRGQHVVVENPGIEGFFFEQNPGPVSTGFFVHGERVLLGSTAERGNWSLEPDARQAEEIIARCVAVEPRLEGARVMRIDVGLRAARREPRVELEKTGDALIVHNYGHGGVAVGLSWGCAQEAAGLAVGVLA